MQLGNELKKDTCPEKYCKQGSFVAESLPILVSSLIVAFFSGNLFQASGVSVAVTVAVEAVFVAVIYGMFFFFMKGMKKRLAETCICVCEGGVLGICALNGFKNRQFCLPYSQITRMEVKKDRLFLYGAKERVILTLKDAPGTAALIQSKLSQ